MASAVPLFNGLKHLPCPKETEGRTCTTTGCLFGHRADSQPSDTRSLHRSFDGAADEEEEGPASDGNGLPPSKRQKTAIHRPGEVEGQGGRVGDGPASGSHITSHPDDSLKPVDRVQASDLYDPLSPPVADHARQPASPLAVTPSSLRNQTVSPSTPLKSSTTLARTTPKVSPPSSASRTPTTSGRIATPTSTVRKPTPVNPSASPPARSPSATRKALATGKSTSSSPPSQKPKSARKPESLNPRHLTAAPASHGVRHKLVSLLHADYTRLNGEVSGGAAKDPQLKGLVLSGQEIIWMVLDREEELATQKAAVYDNAMRQEVMKYKRMKLDAWVAERKQALEKKTAQKTPSIGAPVTINTGLTTAQEVVVLQQRLVTPIQNLEQYGYVPVPPTDEQIEEAKQAVKWSQGWEQCDRCTARFQVFPGRDIETGQLASGGQCNHHPGRAYFPERPKGDTAWIAKKYRCCNQDVGESPGCTVSEAHVWKTTDPKRLASLWNYAETPANDNPFVVKEAVAFDCEMGYTVHGMELIRVTATSWPDGAELLDVLVQPYGEILNLNSRYSGVWPEDLARAVPWTRDWTPPPQQPGERKVLQKVSSPELARDLLHSFINPDTILIGHGLENDLNAMRMVHPKIVDTVLLYPHKRGLPVRTSLKLLMETLLNRRIQVDTGEGHDSAEDARSAGDLVRYKVEKEWTLMKSQGWKWEDGELRAPGWKPPTALPQERSSEESVDLDDGGALLTEGVLEAES